MADQLKGAASGVGNTVSSGAQQVGSGAQSAASSASNAATSGGQDWSAMSEDQKKAAFDKIPDDHEQKQMGYYEWVKQGES